MMPVLLLCSFAVAQQQDIRVTSPDQKTIVISDGIKVDRIDAASQKTIWSYRGGKGKITALAFSPDGKFVGIGDDQKEVRLVDSATGKELRRIMAAAGVTKLTFSPDGRVMIAKLVNQAESKWDIATGQLIDK